MSAEKILNLDRRIVWAIFVILLAVPLAYPIGLPLKVDKITQEYYDVIENLEPGAIVFCVIDLEAGLWGELGAQSITTTQHLFDMEGIYFIESLFYRADAQTVFETMILSEVDQKDKEYGKDWVNLGYIEGKETAMSAVGADFLYPGKDAYGNELSSLPLLQTVKSVDDVDLVLIIQGSGYNIASIRQFAVPYNKPSIMGTMSMGLPEILSYYDAGIVDGILSGLTGAAQYEFLRHTPGLAIRGMDAISLSHIFLIGLMLVVNILYISSRKEGVGK